MDPTQLKAIYDQTQYLADNIAKVDVNLLKSNAAQTHSLSNETNNLNRDMLKGFDATQIENLKSQAAQNHLLSNEHNNINRDMLKGFDATQIEYLKSQSAQNKYLADNIAKVDSDLLKSQAYQNVESLKSGYAQTKDILDTQERSQYANENRQNRNFQLLNDNIKDQGGSVRDTIYRTSAMLNDAVGKGASDNLLATERIGAHVDDNIYRTAAGIDQNIYRSQTAVNDAVTQSRIEAQKNTNELIGYFKSINDNNWSNFGNLTKDIYQGKAESILSNTNQYANLAKQASDNTAAIQIEALKSKADLSKQMAFEYSSLKDKISDSESSIKAVLATQEADRLRDALRSTEHKGLYFELKNGRRHRRHHH
jgi:hypothetical protein